jgi:hypothetical protein
MKRRDAIIFLINNHCYLIREGNRHSIFINLSNNRASTLPRHKEINDFLFKKICKDLGIN